MAPLPASVVDAMLWRDYRPAKQRLRIGVLVDHWRVPDWIFRAIDLLGSQPFLELAALLKHQEPLPRPSKRPLLFKLLLAASLEKVNPEHPYHDLAEKFPSACRENLSEAPSLDILVRFDKASLSALPNELAKLGVWSIGLGSSPEVPYFAEVRNQEPLSLLTLSHHPKSLDQAQPFYTYAAPTLQGWFFTKNAVEPLRLAGVLLVDRLLEVAVNGYGSVVSDPGAPAVSSRDRPNLNCGGLMVRQTVRSITGRLRGIGRSQRWVSAMRPVNASAFKEIPTPAGHGHADPFLIESESGDCLLIEDVPPGGRGRLAAMNIARDGTLGQPEIILEKPYHVSYPFVFRHEADLFLIPETANDKTVQLYRAGPRVPFEWHFEKNLFEGAMLVDTTVFHHEGLWYFFTTQVDYGMRAYLFYADSLDGAWNYHPRNPICSDASRSRGAGALFYRDGRLIRPVQDCSIRYGYGIVFNEVRKLSRTEYEEVPVERREPSWWGKGNIGTHTFNANARWEVTDGRRFMR
jgi:hypothetical protein